MRRTRTLSGILGGCLLLNLNLWGCEGSSKTPDAGPESSGAPAEGGGAGTGESSSAGTGQDATGGNGGKGGTGSGGDCGDCEAGGDAGTKSGPTSACHATANATPNLPAPASLDADAVARAAAVIGSCMPDDGVARNATHIWLAHFGDERLYFRYAAQLSCVANSACGCAAIEHCLGFRYEGVEDACPASCDGTVFHGCGDSVKVSIDCARFGLACDPEGNCVGSDGVSCTGEKPSCTAEGEVRFCDDGFMRTTPCASLGFSCVEGKCTGKGDPCSVRDLSELELSAPVGTGCRGSVLDACLGGKSTSLDCAEQGPGFTCQTVGDAHFCGLGADCVPADNYESATLASCDGNLLTFCNAGRRERIDCRTLGFDECHIDEKLGLYGCTSVLAK